MQLNPDQPTKPTYMLMAGKQVTKPNDPLHPVDVVRVYKGLIDPHGIVADKIRQLRALRSVDPEAYRRAKTSLPYLVSAFFSPATRNRQHFAYAECFILDIDKLGLIGRHPEELKSSLAKDGRIQLMFTSPGNDGLKLLFRLKERMTDAGYYSTFYRIFAADFAKRHDLGGRVDMVTHDVSRCCFMSFDPAAHYDPDSMTVDALEFVRVDDIYAIQSAEKSESRLRNANGEEQSVDGLPASGALTVKGDVLDSIRAKLLPSLQKRRPEKHFIQPEALSDAIPGLTEALAQMDILLVEHRPIHYGRQLKLVAGKLWAEVNLFYGKGGFRAVPTTKTGSDPELAGLGREAIQLYFDAWPAIKTTSWQGPDASR